MPRTRRSCHGGWEGGVLTAATRDTGAADGGPLELAIGADNPRFAEAFGPDSGNALLFWAHDRRRLDFTDVAELTQ